MSFNPNHITSCHFRYHIQTRGEKSNRWGRLVQLFKTIQQSRMQISCSCRQKDNITVNIYRINDGLIMKIIVPAVSDTCQRPFLTQATSYSIKTKPSLHLVLFHNQSSQASLVDLDKFHHHHHPKLTPTHMHKHTHTNSESLHSADLPHLN